MRILSTMTFFGAQLYSSQLRCWSGYVSRAHLWLAFIQYNDLRFDEPLKAVECDSQNQVSFHAGNGVQRPFSGRYIRERFFRSSGAKLLWTSSHQTMSPVDNLPWALSLVK